MLCMPLLFVAGSLLAEPSVLSSEDFQDNYSREQPPEHLKVGNWRGLYVRPEGSRIEDARIDLAVRRDRDLVIYDIVPQPPGAAFLFSELPSLPSGRAVTVARNIHIWENDKTAQFRIGSRNYRVELRSSDPELCDAVVTLSHEGTTQKLFPSEPPSEVSCDGPHFRIHWAGDLDRDGRLDLLVTFSGKYSYYPRELLLSSAAGHATLVKRVAISEKEGL